MLRSSWLRRTRAATKPRFGISREVMAYMNLHFGFEATWDAVLLRIPMQGRLPGLLYHQMVVH